MLTWSSGLDVMQVHTPCPVVLIVMHTHAEQVPVAMLHSSNVTLRGFIHQPADIVIVRSVEARPTPGLQGPVFVDFAWLRVLAHPSGPAKVRCWVMLSCCTC